LARNNTFTKAERLCSQTAIDWLFDGKGHSFSVFPLRVVFKAVPVAIGMTENSEVATEAKAALLPRCTTPSVPLPQLLISVPKKSFHHAVDRNRIKRLLREAYRTNKQPLLSLVAERRLALTMAFVYIGRDMSSATDVVPSVVKALTRIAKQLDHEMAD